MIRLINLMMYAEMILHTEPSKCLMIVSKELTA